jgi:signal recognition particle subunit SRP54
MFQNLSDRLGQTLKNISGKGRITEENIKETLREVRMALLEADVALPVIKDFVERIKERSVGIVVSKSLNPGQMLIKIVQGELESIMGSENEAFGCNAASCDTYGGFTRRR